MQHQIIIGCQEYEFNLGVRGGVFKNRLTRTYILKSKTLLMKLMTQ